VLVVVDKWNAFIAHCNGWLCWIVVVAVWVVDGCWWWLCGWWWVVVTEERTLWSGQNWWICSRQKVLSLSLSIYLPIFTSLGDGRLWWGGFL
jgi:hypothetical protein